MNNFLSRLRTKAFSVKTAVATAAITSAAAAHAELPTWATSMGAEVSDAASDVFDLVGPIIGTVLVGFIIIKLIKRGSNKI